MAGTICGQKRAFAMSLAMDIYEFSHCWSSAGSAPKSLANQAGRAASSVFGAQFRVRRGR
jgi:hypothetical protein